MPNILDECDKNYESLWESKDLPYYRIVVCKDQLQYIVQRNYGGRWCSKSYHMEWDSLLCRYPNFANDKVSITSPSKLVSEIYQHSYFTKTHCVTR